MKIFLLVVYCVLSACCFGQKVKEVKIGALECFKPDDDNYKQGVLIRPLFIKKKQSWVGTEKLKAGEKFQTYFKGVQNRSVVVRKRYKPFYGGLFTYYWPQPNVPLAKRRTYKASFNKDEDSWIKGAMLLTSSTNVKQRSTLVKYSPSKSERATIHDSLINYMRLLYQNPNCWASGTSDTTEEYVYYRDSLLSIILSKPSRELQFDKDYCFKDEKGNKLITVYYPVGRIYTPYPFLNECWREDRPDRFKVSYYLDNGGHLTFLGDELNFLDHGDFDNDGNDEFIYWTCRHNHEGYIMFYDDFTKKVEHTWSYH